MDPGKPAGNAEGIARTASDLWIPRPVLFLGTVTENK